MNLSKRMKITWAGKNESTGQLTNCAVADMQGWDGIVMLFTFGTITSGAATSIKAQQGAAANMSDGADLLGTSQTVADTDDNKVFYIDLCQPQERYVRGVFSNATQAAICTVCYIQYSGTAAKTTPVTQPTYTTGELHISPAEGTA
jgi:uncharacterized membrane protein